MLQGLKIHQGLEIIHVLEHKQFLFLPVNIESRQLSLLGDRLPIQRSLVPNFGTGMSFASFLKNDSFRKLPQLSKRTCDCFSKMNTQNLESSVCTFSGIVRGTPRPSADHTTHWIPDVGSCHSPDTKVLWIYTRFHRAILQQWKWMQLKNTEQLVFTKPCPPKAWKLEIMFSKHFSLGWI